MSRSEERSGTPDHNATKGVVTRLSPWSVDDTVARLEAVLAARGIKLFTIIDQSAEANAVGLELRDTRLVIFGSPKAGTPVMEAVPLAAVWLYRVTPAAGFSMLGLLPRSGLVSYRYTMANGYYPLPPWAGLLVLGAYAAVALLAASIVLRRRDA